MQTLRGDRAVHGAVLLVLLLSLGIRVHGFSLPIWHELLDGSPKPEVLFGEGRSILSDSWGVYLPLIFSQRHSPEPYATTSHVVGDPGQSMLASFAVPVAHPLTIFRPHLWGYFFGDDVGMSWHWAFFVLMTFEAFFLLGRFVCGVTWKFATPLALAMTLSPFFQLWGMVDAPFVAFAVMVAVSLWRAWSTTATRPRIAWSLAAGFFATCLAFLMYPPYAVTMGYWLLFVLTGAWLELGRGSRTVLTARLVSLLICAVIPLVTLAAFLHSQADTLRLVRETVYPGSRLITGGAFRLLHGIASWFLPAPAHIRNWGQLTNVCEASSFLLLTPFLIVVALVRTGSEERGGALAWSMFAYIAVVLVWQTIGFPTALARVSFWSKVPETRAAIGLGPAEFVILCRLFGRSTRPVTQVQPLAMSAVASLGGALAAGWWIAHNLVPLNPGRVLFGVVAFTLVCVSFLRAPNFAPWVMATVAAVLTLGFNPLVRGGSEFFQTNPLARAMRRAEAKDPGARWLVFNDGVLGNYPRALGIHGLNGVHFYPQFHFWAALDPERLHVNEYNRYASVNVYLATGPVRIRSQQVDGVEVLIDPRSPEFSRLDVRYVLLRGGPLNVAEAFNDASVEYEGAGLRLLRLEPRRPGPSG
jgi:hypothetical protein